MKVRIRKSSYFHINFLILYDNIFTFIADEIVEDDDCELFDDGEVECDEGTLKSGALSSSDEEDINSTSHRKEVAPRKKDLRDMLVPSSSKGAPVPAKRLRFVCLRP